MTDDPTSGVPFEDTDEDEEPVAPQDVTKAVVTGTDWTTETILSQLRRGNIQLNPDFQRRDAWDPVRKSRFIESLILGLPIPQLVLAEDKRSRGAFIVLDGKQRLLALRQFAVGSSVGDDVADSEFVRLHLKKLDVRSELEGMSLVDMEGEEELKDELDAFLNQPIRTVVVRGWPDEAFLNLVFLRLNTGSVQLSPQELRQALHPGPFTNFLDSFSADSESIQHALRSTGPDFRMRDVEILLRFFAFHLFLDDYRGNLKQFLDETTGRLNSEWSSGERKIRDVAALCDRAIDATFEVFGDDAFYRWQNDKFERRFNRAVFDVMTFYFSDTAIARAATRRKQKVLEAFASLCDEEDDFRQSIQTTTKTVGATHTRLHLWGRALGAAISRPVRAPELVDNRIRVPARRA